MNFRTMLSAIAATALSVASAQAQEPHRGPPPPITAIAMMSASIPSSDLQRSIDFYTKGLGLSARARVETDKAIEVPVFFANDGAYLLLQHSKDAKVKLPVRNSLNRIALTVPDLKVLESKLNDAGYKFKEPISEIAEYHVAVAFLADPDGNQIELVQRTP